MKVAALLKAHQSFQDKGLLGNFGDGYLMEHNRVYRQIRNSASLGAYKFSLERDEAYEVFPLLQLERLLQEKTFPYSNNVRLFESMSSQQLSLLSWEDLVGNLKRNFVFHEASHGVIRELILSHFGKAPQKKTLDAQREFVLRVLLEESFANTAELLGLIDAGDTTHRAFYELNSYNTLFEHRTNLKKAIDELGAELLIPFLMLTYLQTNFLRKTLNEVDLKKMLTLINKDQVSPQQIKILRSMSKLAFELSEIFRYQTTAFHLKMNGIETELEDVLDFDFLMNLKSYKELSGFWKKVIFCLGFSKDQKI